jgi:hypothetical protein
MLLEDFPFEPGFRLTDGDLLNKVAAEPAYSVDNTVTATGTAAATAYSIRATTTIITGGADQTGVRLPQPKVGRILFVWNFTASGKKVYPFATDTINSAASADIPFSQGMVLICTGSNSWSATQSTTNVVGDIILDASDADTATGTGHLVQIQGGTGGTTSGSGGGVTITGGSATGATGNGGDLLLASGDSKNGTGGNIILHAGSPTGLVSLETNATNISAPTKASGLIQQNTGATKDAASGAITSTTGSTSGTGVSGDVVITTGKTTGLTGSSTSGNVTITTGATAGAAANTGAINLTTGNPTGAGSKAGAINVTAGTPGGVVTVSAPSIALVGPTTLTGSLQVSGATALNGGGTMVGTFAGNPTFSGNVTISGTVQAGAVATSLPAAKTGAAYSVGATDAALILQPSGTFTLTLPAAAPAGRLLNLKLIAAFAVNSASANVVPLAGGAAAAPILPATAGKYASLQSDGTNWQIMAAN